MTQRASTLAGGASTYRTSARLTDGIEERYRAAVAALPDAEGMVLIGGELFSSRPSSDYDNILPSFNMTMELQED